jgi:lipopolysaccharide biosynthesis glycosyltransferase
MKKALFTLAVGDNPMYKAALKSFQRYADIVNADLIVAEELHYPITLDNPRHTASKAWTEKLYIGELLKEYERVLYLDADIIVAPRAENIFDSYPDLDTLYLFNEGQYLERQHVIDKIFNIMGPLDNWPSVNNRPVYYNVGCMLISNQCRLFDIATLDDLQEICNFTQYYEQTYFNYLIHRDGLKNQHISEKFNRMDALGSEGYREASFIHYAGRGYSNSTLKREARYVNDFCELFDGIFDASELACIKDAGWKLFIDKAKKRYKLPRGMIDFLARKFVTI